MRLNLQVITIALTLVSLNLKGQSDSIWHEKPELSISGFLDIFYIYDFNQPQGTERQSFLFNHNRHNEFNLNLGLVQFSLDQKKYRAHLALHTGTYANDNYSAEPGLLKNIFEANIGLSLNQKNTVWLDVGVLPAHIGFESAISVDNLTLTRSIVAENSPYFLTGAKLTYHPSDKWEIAALIVNGWQRIQRLEGNSLPSFGTQVNFSPSERITLNWSTFIGTDDPDARRRMRYFNNFYGLFQVAKRLSLIAGFDIGIQQKGLGSSIYNVWYVPTLISQLALSENWKIALRAEYYQDEHGVIIPTAPTNGFQTTGLSFNLDYSPTQAIACRLECRLLRSSDQIFESTSGPSISNFIIGASMAIRLPEIRLGR